jgi:hypothetical protein
VQRPEVDEDGTLLHSPDQREREATPARLGRLQWAFIRAAIFTALITWWNWGDIDGSGLRHAVAAALTLVVVTALNWVIDPWLQRQRARRRS